jgi:hypothetical protein
MSSHDKPEFNFLRCASRSVMFSAAASSNNADLFEIMKVASIISVTGPQSHGRGVSILLLRFITRQQCQCGFSEHHYIDSPISAIYFDNEALI